MWHAFVFYLLETCVFKRDMESLAIWGKGDMLNTVRPIPYLGKDSIYYWTLLDSNLYLLDCRIFLISET